MKTVAVVQARMGSSRLPGKVLLPVAGAPMLTRMLERLRAAETLHEIVVATTVDEHDQPIRDLCRDEDVRCHSGHPTDLLDRHIEAGRLCQADVVVKIPSDCPLIDPRIVDRVVGFFLSEPHRWDFVSNLHPASYPDGLDVEVMPMPMLELAWKEAQRPHEREHTTPFFWDQPHRFRIGNVAWERGIDLSMSHRLTVDYQDDYRLVCAVFDELHQTGAAPFSLDDILKLLERRPEVFALNAHLAGVNWYRHHLDELRTVSRRQTVVFEDA